MRVIVIGGSGTLGRVVCAELAARGARVGLTFCTDEQSARELGEQHGAVSARLDLTRPDDIAPTIARLAGQLGGLDALVYCAAVSSTRLPQGFDALDDITPEGFRRLFAINVDGAFFALREAARHIGEAGGNLVLLGSVDGVKPAPIPVPYATSKGALGAMAASFGKALGRRNIRVNVVAPGILSAGASRTVPDALRSEYLRHSGLKRVGTLEEAARVVAFFALDNRYVTGQTLPLDGGL
jgi:3-oxoacyl-[acyl-carrier protein] reductase